MNYQHIANQVSVLIVTLSARVVLRTVMFAEKAFAFIAERVLCSVNKIVHYASLIQSRIVSIMMMRKRNVAIVTTASFSIRRPIYAQNAQILLLVALSAKS